MTDQTLLIHRADCIATFDHADASMGRELRDASLLVRGHAIEWMGPAADVSPETLAGAGEVVDARGHLVVPGLVNTHHHMYQSLTRAIPGVQDAELFSWLRGLYPIWAGLTPEMVQVSTQVAMAELLLSGCTTSSDHLYIYPNGVRLEDAIEGAQRIGMRFVATRGSMSVGQSLGGLPPDRVVEKEDTILKDSQRHIETWHDASHGAMVQVALAPCSPFSVSPALMKASADLARSFKGLGVRLHTHLAENDHDIAYSREKFNMTPAQYAQELGWLGDDVWHAHCVKLDDEGISLFAASRTGVAHCPCSNMRLASDLDRGQRAGGGARRPAGFGRSGTPDRTAQPAGPATGRISPQRLTRTGSGLAGRETAVHQQVRAGDEAGLITEKKQRRVGHLFGPPQAPDGVKPDQELLRRRIQQGQQGRVEVAGADRIHTHPLGGAFQRRVQAKGAMTFERTPLAAPSRARVRVMLTTPPLAAV